MTTEPLNVLSPPIVGRSPVGVHHWRSPPLKKSPKPSTTEESLF
ncbi:MAG: hypothetical protein WBA57_19575 [Elainellaceae cyanobacterium]